MVTSIAVQTRSVLVYFILCTVFWYSNTYLSNIFCLDIWYLILKPGI